MKAGKARRFIHDTAPSYGSARPFGQAMPQPFFHVYILQSVDKAHFYTGFTEDLDARLKHHNSGGDPHTSKYIPWRIKTSIAFTDREQALAFERYLKSGSGRAFATKRL